MHIDSNKLRYKYKHAGKTKDEMSRMKHMEKNLGFLVKKKNGKYFRIRGNTDEVR